LIRAGKRNGRTDHDCISGHANKRFIGRDPLRPTVPSRTEQRPYSLDEPGWLPWKTLGPPVLTPEVQRAPIDSVRTEVGSRTIEELEVERDDILLGLLELHAERPRNAQPAQVAAV
jgi:hypothetical protein